MKKLRFLCLSALLMFSYHCYAEDAQAEFASIGTMNRASELIMGGRFIEQTYKGEFMGHPFEGRGIYGYDNLQKEYNGLWFDNMGTGIMFSTGKYDAAAKTLTDTGTMSCPMTEGGKSEYKAVTTFVDADHFTYESYMKDKEGKEFKGMIIT